MPTNLHAWEPLAEQALDAATFGYIAGGAGDERTLRDNSAAFGRLRLVPRMLRGTAGGVDASTTVLGAELASPIMVAPFAYQGAFHPDGEAATAAAAAALGLCMCLSTLANTSMEDVAAASGGGVRWFQLYPMADQALNDEMIARAEAAGYRAVIVTVDLPPYGVRERELHHPFALPADLGLPCIPEKSAAAGSPTPVQTTEMMKLDLDWSDIAAWASRWNLPLVVKGVLSPEDAALALEHGARGVIVSNHGGRQLDTTIATIDALPRVCAAVADRAEVFLDGGVRRGTDVVKALALGARAVLIGRPAAYGLAVAGRDGASAVLAQLISETENALALCGCRTVAEACSALIAPET
ncbi:MAG: alpha-hydroxy-acid oxidizing protein [Thermoleophilia bacterium]|nr:alpha-hydroxy-acid oxidizing protein [Thermoleophilia bacterium]MDH3725197.1 alpha-hydroxy-acid oxidizing protein [Thermoleophilia bacterium]